MIWLMHFLLLPSRTSSSRHVYVLMVKSRGNGTSQSSGIGEKEHVGCRKRDMCLACQVAIQSSRLSNLQHRKVLKKGICQSRLDTIFLPWEDHTETSLLK